MTATQESEEIEAPPAPSEGKTQDRSRGRRQNRINQAEIPDSAPSTVQGAASEEAEAADAGAPFGIAATLLDTVPKPGSQEWIDAGISGSRMAAIMGCSGYSSMYQWWHVMAGLAPYEEEETDITRRGHLLEPAVAQWFAEENPHFTVHTTGTWRHRIENLHIASPDRILVDRETGEVALLECKTAARGQEWGEPGSDEIPPAYRIQVQWTMHVLGVDRCHVAVLNSWLTFEEFVVDRDDDEIARLVAAANEFMDSLPGRAGYVKPPPVDGHPATYDTVKAMHPQIEDQTVQLDAAVVTMFRDAQAWYKEAETQKRWATAQVAEAMGMAKYAKFGDDRVARRQAKKGGIPFVVSV